MARRGSFETRGRIGRTARAVRSGFRRYPRAFFESLLEVPGPVLDSQSGVVERLGEHDLALSWIGHASVLCRTGQVAIAVDPVLSPRIGMRIGKRVLGPARQLPTPVSPACLRSVNIVLLTHAHFDHLDRPTLAAMAHPATEVFTPPGCESLVPAGFAGVHAIASGRSVETHGIRITAIEPRHWGARTVLDRFRKVNSYLVESEQHRVLFAGDTAATDAFGSLSPVEVAVFGIGAYEPWEHMHATPEQVWQMFVDSGARWLLPVHHSTFELSDEPMDEPMRRLLTAAGDAREKVIEAEIGEVVAVKK